MRQKAHHSSGPTPAHRESPPTRRACVHLATSWAKASSKAGPPPGCAKRRRMLPGSKEMSPWPPMACQRLVRAAANPLCSAPLKLPRSTPGMRRARAFLGGGGGGQSPEGRVEPSRRGERDRLKPRDRQAIPDRSRGSLPASGASAGRKADVGSPPGSWLTALWLLPPGQRRKSSANPSKRIARAGPPEAWRRISCNRASR